MFITENIASLAAQYNNLYCEVRYSDSGKNYHKAMGALKGAINESSPGLVEALEGVSEKVAKKVKEWTKKQAIVQVDKVDVASELKRLEEPVDGFLKAYEQLKLHPQYTSLRKIKKQFKKLVKQGVQPQGQQPGMTIDKIRSEVLRSEPSLKDTKAFAKIKYYKDHSKI